MNDSLFRIKKPTVTTEGFRAYWVESTAPLDVDDLDEKPAADGIGSGRRHSGDRPLPE